MRGGAGAGAGEPPGTMLLWLFDTSAGEEERAKLGSRLRQTEGALNSLTHLIEAAPFPMWYPRPRPQARPGQQRLRPGGRRQGCRRVIERGVRADRRAGRGQRGRDRARRRRKTGRIVSRMQPAIIRGERRMLRIVNVPLSTGAVAGFAVDVQDLEDARAELARHIESQRELADRMTAGTAQFDADRTLSFFNRPFAVMSQLDPDWLAEKPEFDRVIDRMRDNQRLPEARDFPAWKDERRDWFTSAEEVDRGRMDAAQRRPYARRRPAACPTAGSGCSSRTAPSSCGSLRRATRLLRVRAATFDNLFEAISVFASDGRLYLWNRRFLEDWELDEEWLATHPRVDELVPAMARKLVNPTAAAQIREMVRQTTNERQSANGPDFDDRRPPFPVRRSAAARRQRAVHDGRRHRLRAGSRRRCANAPPRSRKPTG